MLLLMIISSIWTTTDSSSYIAGAQGRVRGLTAGAGTTLESEVPLSSAMPYFVEPHNSVNVTGQLGAGVELHCRVNQLSTETSVSWLRRQQGHLRLLAVGLELYSSDSRYSVRLQDSSDWQLRLRPLLETDQGHYECQVPSHPPLVHSVYLIVVVPELDITDERDVSIKDKFYNAGSTIQLKCRLTKVPRPTHFLMWKHNRNILNHDSIRGGISVRTDLTEDGAWSRLLIAHASAQDSGNYSCSLADVSEASITVHVLNGETPAAMQHGGSGHVHVCWTLLFPVFLVLSR